MAVPRLSDAAFYDPKLKWKTVDTEHFSIHYYEGEEEIARRLVQISEEVYASLSRKFDARPWGKTEVVLTDNHDSANGFTTVIPYNLVVLRVVAATPDSSLGDYDDWLRELFAHEYTHVLHISDTRYPAKLVKFFVGKLMAPNGLSPGWVTEGIATYFESAETGRGRGRSSATEMLLRTDILQGRFLRLDQMAGTQYEWPGWLAQYLYGVGFWNFLSERYGEEKIAEFSHKYGASLWFFALNHQAKRVFGKGKSFYKLWKEWKGSLEERYAAVKAEREAEGLREGIGWFAAKKGESQALPLWSRDGGSLAYLSTSIHHSQQLRLREVSTGKERVLLKKRDPMQITFSPDGKRLVFSSIGTFRRYFHTADLHEIDLETGKVRQLTKGERARDPDFSPDGKTVVCVLQRTGFSELSLYDPEKGEFRTIPFPGPAEFNNPRWSPDGRWIAVSVHSDGRRDLWLVEPRGRARRRVTSDVGIEDRPAWAPTGRSVYFSSDRDGIPNLYRYDLLTGRTARVTNVLTGAFAPAVSPTGEVAFQYYNGRGFEVRRLVTPAGRGGFPGGTVPARSIRATKSVSPQRVGVLLTSTANSQARSDFSRSFSLAPAPGSAGKPPLPAGVTSRPYNPFRRLFVPRYVLPNAILLDNAVFLSAAVGNIDPLIRHRWSADVTFRSDNRFFGYGAAYNYNRYRLIPFTSFSVYSVNYGDRFGFGTDYFEERKRASGGVSIPFGAQGLSFSYFFENRAEESGLPAGTTLATLGRYAGLFAHYEYGKTRGTAAGISPEGGGRLNVNVEFTDEALGASQDLEQRVAWADGRLYLRMPYSDHHVVALRGAGGMAFGDQLLQGSFGLGGSIGEGLFTGTSSRVFTLRGLPLVTFSRDRAWVASAEYRLPLFRIQRGIGTLPLAWNSGHLGLFADLGDAFNRDQADFQPLLGVGAELRADFVIGYHLPIEGRLGYGIILTNRDRIAGVEDALTGADARNGVVILELGTSF